MYPYPPWEMEWGWWLCSVIVPAAAIAGLLIVGARSASSQRLTTPIVVMILLWMLFMTVVAPGMGSARPTARRVECMGHLRLISEGIHAYHDQHGELPAPTLISDNRPPTSWRIDLLPYSRADASSGEDYNRSASWDESANLPVARRQQDIYWCPANRTPQDSQDRWYTAYAFLTGSGTAFPEAGPLTLDDITDGTSSTLLVVEACGRNIVWTEPRDVDVSDEAIAVNTPGEQRGMSPGIMSSYHAGFANALFADGHAEMIGQDMDESVLRALTTAAEGDGRGEF